MKSESVYWKILIVEDDPDLSGLMKAVLERAGYLVACAANGADAILLNERNDPDLILLDLHLPEMDGIATLRNIRKHDDQVLVVILTGYACPDTIRDAAQGNRINLHEYSPHLIYGPGSQAGRANSRSAR